jgi:hypothetical protein
VNRRIAQVFSLLLTAILCGGIPAPNSLADSGGLPGGLTIYLSRPGEGETFYSGPSAPRTLVPVIGQVQGSEFALNEVEIELEILQAGQSVAKARAPVEADGHFTVNVLTNATGNADLGSPEHNCYTCHENAPLTLPPGGSTLRLTAVEPSGRKTSLERSVSLDASGLARLRVTVQLADQPQQILAGLPISATTQVYSWRNRVFSAPTDSYGQANMELEALALASTHYRLRVPPTLLDGVLYQTSRPVEMDFAAGATHGDPVSLTVEAHYGQIAGSVALPDDVQMSSLAGLSVTAVDLLSGQLYESTVKDGAFHLDKLLLRAYLLGVDPGKAAAAGLQSNVAQVNLASALAAQQDFLVTRSPNAAIHGTVSDSAGRALPFSWIIPSNGTGFTVGSPTTGNFVIAAVAGRTGTMSVGAPGYWSRLAPTHSSGPLKVRLRAKPDTANQPWGLGSLVIPGETDAIVTGNLITLRRGWVWGEGDGKLVISTRDADFTLDGGSFAVVYLPGEDAWFLSTSGEARLSRSGDADTVISPGQMVAFSSKDLIRVHPVPANETAWALLQSNLPLPIIVAREPGVVAAIENLLAPFGLVDLSLPVLLALGAGFAAAIAAIALTRRTRRLSRPAQVTASKSKTARSAPRE